MAKINPVKVKKDADKEEKAGRLDKAIALHQQLLKLNSRDWNTINKVGDLYARMGKNREASQQYAKVAEFYAEDGFLLKAIAIWKKINRLDASALEPYLKLADLYAKQGLMMEAKSQYQIVVDEYIKRGKGRDAGDVLQKMADIDPSDLKIRSRLADLYMRAGQKGKAIEEHIAIAEQLNLKGHLPEAVQVLQKGLKIDGQDSKLMLELARLHLVQNDYSEAVQYLEQVSEGNPDDTEVLAQLGDAYLGSGRVADAQRVFKRLVDLEPGNENHRTQMGRLHIAKNDLDRALDEFGPVIDSMLERQDGMSANFLLQEILEKDPQHVKTLVKLVAVYRALGNEDQVASTYQELTEAYVKKADWEQAASVLEILVGMDPDNQQHSSKLQFVKQKLGGGEPAAAPEPSLAIEVDEGLPDLGEIGEVGELGDLGIEPEPVLAVEPAAEEPTSAPQGSSIQLSDPPSEEDKEFIEEHLAEGRVFRKYGLIDKALDQFDAVIARFPDNVETRLELKEVFEEKGEPQKAAEQCIAVAEIHRLRGDEDAAQEILDAARELAPELVPEAPGALELEPESVEAIAEPELEPEPSPEPDLGLEPEPSPEPDLGLDLGAGEDEESIPLELEEPVAEPTPEPPADASPLGALDLEPAAEPDTGLDLDLDLAAPAPLQVEPEEALPAAAAVAPEVQRVLDEVDSFVSLGFVDDARDALRKARAQFPDDPAIAEKMEEFGVDELEELPAPAPEPAGPELSADNPLGDLTGELEPPAPAAPEPDQGGFGDGMLDLAGELDDIFGTQSATEEEAPAEDGVSSEIEEAGLSEMFKEFRKGVNEQIGEEDLETRYNLGIAYKEMGLVDEAIAEFQMAARDQDRLLSCASMLGICFMDKGMPKLAINWFEKGLAVPDRHPQEYHGVRYDLASAYEAAGETGKAIEHLTELYAADESFRDVSGRLRELKAAAG